tara:strand:+ start:373 stop:2109 length:1737 start_codon:yes stop_codon:yes gene_type:complete
MPGHTRSIYSRRQRTAPGQFDNPLADFLDALPGYVNQFQQNQLALGRQQLAEKRYEEDRDYRRRQERRAIDQQNIENLKFVQQQKQAEANRKTAEYNRLVKDRREEYEGIISTLDDPKQKAIVANRYGYDEDSRMFESLNDSDDERLGKLTTLTDNLKSLPQTATYYDYDKAYKESGIDPEDIEFYRKKDLFGYSDLVKQREKFENQRSTGFRSMPKNVSKQLEDLESQRRSIGNQIVKAYAEIGYDIRGTEVTPDIIKNLEEESGISTTGAVDSLMRDYGNAQSKIDQIYNQYRITAPQPEVTPAISPFIARPDYDTDTQSLASTRGEALDQNELVNAQYVLATEPEDSQEYKNAMNLLSQGSDIDITTSRPLPGISGLIERLSVAGQQIQEGEREDSGFRINPNALAFDLPPEGRDNPEYYDRVARQFEIEAGKLRTLTLNPEQYEGAGRRGANQKTIELNNALKTRDNLVSQVKDLYRQIPKTRKFAKQIKMFKDIIKNNPTGLQVTLDRDARGGKGAFKFNKGKLSKADNQLLAEINKELNFDEDQQPTQNLMQRLINLSGAMADPLGTPQPIQ